MNYSSFLKCKVMRAVIYTFLNQLAIMFRKFAGTTNYICPVSSRDLHIAISYAEVPDPPALLPFLEAANELMMEQGLRFPGTVEDDMSLYGELVALFEARV